MAIVVLTIVLLFTHAVLFKMNKRYHDKVKELIRKPGFIIAILFFFALFYIVPICLSFVMFWGIAEGFH